MTTVLAVHTSDGCIGRCDANCHEAKHDHCTCICGGKNHGRGLKQAIENTKEMIGLTEQDLNRFAVEHQRNPDQLVVVDRVKVTDSRKARRYARNKLEEPDLFEDWMMT